MTSNLDAAYRLAAARYSELGVDTEVALAQIAKIPDVAPLLAGRRRRRLRARPAARSAAASPRPAIIRARPGRPTNSARTPTRRCRSSRDAIDSTCTHVRRVRRASAWIAMRSGRNISPRGSTGRRRCGIGLDFNPTFFSHPQAADNFTLVASRPGRRASSGSRTGSACRRIGAAMGEALGNTCVTNLWIPDGMKDTPVDRVGPRERLLESLDAVFAEPIDPALNLDAVEGKLFGIGGRELHGRLARVLSRLRAVAPACC